jgi:hypothetical protein
MLTALQDEPHLNISLLRVCGPYLKEHRVLVKEIIAAYSKNHTKPINTLCGQSTKLEFVKVR